MQDWITVSDRQAIAEMLYRYCRCVDRLDRELGYSIWHEGAEADYGDFYHGDGPGLINLICRQHEHLLYHSHQLSNILIELDGVYAVSESYVTANLRLQQGEKLQQMTVWSRYLDHWSKRNGCWGIDRRQALRDFDEIRDVVPLSQVSSEGARDASDPSCQLFKQLPTSF